MAAVDSKVSVSLSPVVDGLWRSCHDLQNEMVITCTGRRIFPNLEYTVAGLDPDVHYTLALHIELADDKRLRYSAGQWTEMMSGEPVTTPRKVWHLNGAALGKQWMSKPVTFEQIRITNKKSREDGNSSYVHLHTQHRYMPVLSIYECAPDYATAPKLVSSHRITHSQFITVTAYHREEINTLKTNNNPYSTGSRKERRRGHLSPSTSSEDSRSETSSTSPPPKKKKTKMAPVTAMDPLPQMVPMPAFNMFQAYYQLFSQLAAVNQNMQPFPFGLPFPASFTPPVESPELAASVQTGKEMSLFPFQSLTPPSESPEIISFKNITEHLHLD